MTCPGCAQENRPGARFCGGCGASLAPRCPACGAPAGFEGAKFCDACGAVFAGAPAEKAIARKVVTVVFADLIGSMALHERRDAESARRVTDRYHRAMTAAVEVHGGRVVQLLGDGVLAAFGVPRVAEDDAIRAVRAAVGMQRAFRELAREQGDAMAGIGLRVAVNTGEIVVSDDETAVIGDASNVAARLQHEAGDGEVIIGEATQRLVGELVTLAPLGSFALRGREGAVAAYRVVSLERPARAQALAFVGRDEELRRLLAVYDAACSAPGARLAVLLGSPGLGKSRLLAELARRAGARASVLAARCDEARGATFAPLAEALRGFLRIEEGAGRERLGAAIDALVAGSEAERARIAAGIAALLSGEPAPPEETFFVVRRFLAALAAVRPVVLAIDDLHWAEPLLLDLVEHLVQWSTGVPLLLVAAARPELRDTRSSLVTPGPLVTDVVTLAGLEAGSAMRLAASVIGASELPAALAGRVLATSEGNPLFVAELVRMLVQDGTLRREGERWVTTVELADLEMPPTIQVLLAARIERLRTEERAVLERAAVVGRHFSRAAVAHLLGRDAGALDMRLEALRRSELIEPDSTWFLGEPGLRFHHVLIRDAAYRRVLRETRAELHERFADWVAARAADSVEHDETLGWHLEQAHQNLRELGPLDARGRSLGERAARHLGAAGQRALARDDVSLAAGLLGRALECLPADHASRADLALDWCEALLSAGDVAHADQAVGELGRLAGGSERLRAWHTCFRGQLAALTDPQALRATAGEVAGAAESLASLGDAAGEAKAHSVHATALQRLGEIGPSETALDRALSAARRARDRRRANAASAGGPQAALWGPTPVTRASGRCLDVVRVLRITERAPAVEAVALRCQALLEELRGRSDAARRMIASARQMVEELGLAQQIFEADVFAGHIELLEGDSAAAERHLRDAYEGLREHGLGIDAARAGALLGRALLAQDRAAEAEALSHESETLAGDDLKAAMGWRGVRAEALARRGEHAAAIELAREAVEIAAKTDGLLDHADARTSLAVALHAAGRVSEALAEERRALELWDQKGATLLVERARSDAGRVAVAERATEIRRAGRPARRRVRENHATAFGKRVDAAVVSRDVDALPRLVTDDCEAVHHPTGRVWSRDELVTRFRQIALQSDALVFEHEPLATLGDELGLFRLHWSADTFIEEDFATGAVETERFIVVEAGRGWRASRVEAFAEDRLDDAILRLYQRYAELLPEGPERDRAVATARSVEARSLPLDDDSVSSALAPDVVYVDHGRLGLGPVAGIDAYLRQRRAWAEIATDFVIREQEILALRPDALLTRRVLTGTDRVGGGAFERDLLALWIFGADGRVAHWEFFDLDHEADALARFDELTADRPLEVRRRVVPNAATAWFARAGAAVAARDEAAIAERISDGIEVIDHTTGASFGRDGALASFHTLLQDVDPSFRPEPLATLGDSLALARRFKSASGVRGGTFDVAAYESEALALAEVDSHGRLRRCELFGSDHLRDAVERLYERYAELLPQGPERERAAATAHAIVGPSLGRGHVTPDIEFVDHRRMGFGSLRGAQAFLRLTGSLDEAAPGNTYRTDDVLAARPDALLWRVTNSGVDRATGGAFERHLLRLSIHATDGRIQRVEQFEVEDAEAALARFDELTAEVRPAVRRPAVGRRVRPNAATAHEARFHAVEVARDLDALADLVSESAQIVHHPTGATYGRDGLLESIRGTFASTPEVVRQHEYFATLGETLALIRFSQAGGSLTTHRFDTGAFEHEQLALIEVDGDGRRRYSEVFAPDHLTDAISRLYARYAELLPEGPERDRALATAGTVGSLKPLVGDFAGAPLYPDVEFFDHRTLGLGPQRGAEAYELLRRSWSAVTVNRVMRDEEILDLRPHALLTRRVHSGTDRAGGGIYERELLALWTFGPDGRITHFEQFDPDREAEALARFDELTGECPTVQRRVRPNAATANAARLDAALVARDLEQVADLYPESAEIVHHPTGATWGRDGLLTSIRKLLSSTPDFVRREEPLATLGDSIALVRRSISASVSASRHFDVGAFEREQLNLIEVDANGRRRHTEVFAPDRLADAIARLYTRHAELLPEGPERTRAEVTARVMANRLLHVDEEWARDDLIASNIEFTDHRRLGIGRGRGVERMLRARRARLELEASTSIHVHDVLALQSDAILMDWTTSGIERKGGGPFERDLLMLWTFAPDGRLARVEWFDPDHRADALASFEELTADRPPRVHRRVRPNSATVQGDRAVAAIENGDFDALCSMLAEDLEIVHRPSHAIHGREWLLRGWGQLAQAPDGTLAIEPLAVLGDSLALGRHRGSASGVVGRTFDFGPYEVERIILTEVDGHGRQRRSEVLEGERLGEAIVRLYERYAELLPEGPQRTRAAAIARSVAAWTGTLDFDRLATSLAPSVGVVDHRTLGTWSSRGSEEALRHWRSLLDVAADITSRDDDVLALEPGALLVRRTFLGTDRRSGGAYEVALLAIFTFGTDGLVTRTELFDSNRDAAALARFDELVAEPPRGRVENAATRLTAAFVRAMHARDWGGIVAIHAPDARLHDRRSIVGRDLAGGHNLASLRFIFDLGVSHWRKDLLATRGDRLALFQVAIEAEGEDAGPSLVEFLQVVEVDASDRFSAIVTFDPDDLDAAYAELDARYAAGEGRECAHALAQHRAWMDAFVRRDFEALVAHYDAVVHDHRKMGFGVLSASQHMELLRRLVELATDARVREDHLEGSARAFLMIGAMVGTRDGGEFELPRIVVREFSSRGALLRIDHYDHDQLDEARARFAAISVDRVR